MSAGKLLAPGCVEACPGCPHRDWPAARSLAQKQAYLARVLAPWTECLAPIQGPPASARLGYRDKTTLRCEWVAGRWRAGLRRRDQLVALPACPVHSPRVNAALALLLPRLPAPATGFALHYYVQAGAQLTLVLKQSTPAPTDWLDPATGRALAAAGIEGLWLQFYPSAGYHKFSKRGWRLLWGRPRSFDNRGLRYGPGSFQQLLPELHRAALERVEDFLEPGPQRSVIDLYCGNGASLRRWLDRGAPTLGVEVGGESFDNAACNAPGAMRLRGCCAHRLPQIEQWRAAAPAPGVFANPPRTGLEPAVLDWLAESARPERLAYLSCSGGTLGRDLAWLCAAGYRVQALQGFDFFPRTRHVETLALLKLATCPSERGADSNRASP